MRIFVYIDLALRCCDYHLHFADVRKINNVMLHLIYSTYEILFATMFDDDILAVV